MKLISETLSICPECLKIIKANVIKGDSLVYLEKECNIHGKFKVKHNWDKEKVYNKIMNLLDYKGSVADGLIINITYKCNMNCPFCFAHANEKVSKDIKENEIEELMKDYPGNIIYLSGGEPTVVKNLYSIIKLVKRKRYKLGLFTNGKKLKNKYFVKNLKEKGVDFVILQFDTLKDENYVFLRGEPLFKIKLKALENLKKYNIPIYLFAMLVKEKNINEVGELINFVSENRDFIKIINFNPVWRIGRREPHEEITTSDILESVKNKTGIKTEDFLDCTEFAYYFFFIMSKLQGKGYSIQPKCELRCYVFFDSGKKIPLTKIIYIKKMAYIFKRISQKGFSRKMLFISILSYLPFFSFQLIKSFLTKKLFRKLLKVFIVNLKKNINNISLFNLLPFTSIIIGTFQTAENLDFNMVKNCNLYSDLLPEGNFVFSACVRQILFNKVFKNKDIDIYRLLKSYQKVVGKNEDSSG